MDPTAVSGRRANDEVTSTALRGIRVVPRLPDIDFADTDIPPRLWHGGSAGVTAFWDAPTIAGPPIESFSCATREGSSRSSRAPRSGGSSTTSCAKRRCTRASISAHISSTDIGGVPVVELAALMRRVLGWVERVSTTKLRSGMVVAGEHFLGEIGHQGLTNAALLAEADPRLARLLLWHFYEEVEHKAVASTLSSTPTATASRPISIAWPRS